jgi:hypothetical protein
MRDKLMEAQPPKGMDNGMQDIKTPIADHRTSFRPFPSISAAFHIKRLIHHLIGFHNDIPQHALQQIPSSPINTVPFGVDPTNELGSSSATG